jgi:hypothetical protein
VPGPILYSANPYFAHYLAVNYRHGVHFAWCSECYDPTTVAATSAAAAIAPSSSPRGIFERLKADCDGEDKHSSLIKGYRKKFRRLAKGWWADRSINADAYAEIDSIVKSASWKIWRPVLYVIPRAPIESAGRLKTVPYPTRAGLGPELQIADLALHEFDLIMNPPK